MADKILVMLSMDEDFSEKFMGFINNLNMLNNDVKPQVKIENVYFKKKEKEYAAVPIIKENDASKDT